MMRYMQALARIVVKNPIVWIVLVVCQVMLLMPFATSAPTLGTHLGQEFLRENALKPAEDSWARGYPGASQKELDEFELRLNLLREACATDDMHEYAELRSQIERLELEWVERRSLVGPTQLEAESALRFFEHMADLDDPQIYLTYREAPMWFYLAAQHASLPMLVWLAPGLVACACVLTASRGRRLVAQAPVGAYRARAAQMLVTLLFFTVGMVLIALPSALATALVNGVGEAAYPVTNATRSLLLDRTAGETVARAFALYAGCALLATSAAYAIAELLSYRFAPAAVVAIAFACALPLVSDYMELQNVRTTGELDRPLSVDYNLDANRDLKLYNPMTYVQGAAEVAGYANYYPNAERTVDDRLTLEFGATVLAGWAAALCVVDAGVLAWRNARIKRFDAAVDAPLAGAGAFAVRGLTIAHGRNTLMRDASLDITRGEAIGLVAPNGRGKTTLIEALVGVNGARRAGSVRMEGAGLAQHADFFRNALYVPCDAKLLYGHLTAADHIKLASSLWPHRIDVDKLVKLCGIEGYMRKPVVFCSSGMKQQIALAVAYCTGVRYLLLDEPMNALDPGNVSLNSYILARLSAQGHGVLLSSHILSNLDEVCGQVVFIEDGTLVRHPVDGGDDIRSLYARVYGAPDAGRHAKKDGSS